MTIDINELLRLMIDNGASDLHLKVPSRPVLRINGTLAPLNEIAPLSPMDVKEAFEAITTSEQRDDFARDKELDLAYSMPGLARFRVNVSYQRGTLSLAFRSVPTKIPSINELGLPEVCKSLALRPRGLVLVTGPTGCGKSTTLAAMIDHVNRNATRRVVTIEDPIEFLHMDKKSFIAQRELGQDTYSFGEALRHVLRQDPDVILIGEMRDLDTIATAITAAETGHLVLGTLHTSSAPKTVDRIVGVFPASQQQQVRQQLSLFLEGVLTQELLPRANGQGRVVAVEVMLATSAIRSLIREDKIHQIPNVLQTSSQLGMQSLDQALQALVQHGEVTVDEALVRARDPELLRRMLEQRT